MYLQVQSINFSPDFLSGFSQFRGKIPNWPGTTIPLLQRRREEEKKWPYSRVSSGENGFYKFKQKHVFWSNKRRKKCLGGAIGKTNSNTIQSHLLQKLHAVWSTTPPKFKALPQKPLLGSLNFFPIINAPPHSHGNSTDITKDRGHFSERMDEIMSSYKFFWSQSSQIEIRTPYVTIPHGWPRGSCTPSYDNSGGCALDCGHMPLCSSFL